MRSLIDVTDLSTEEIAELIDIAGDIMDNPGKYSESCRGKQMGTLFFEPSTRTRLSFASAMMGLGGNVLGFSQAQNSSAAKGESVADTCRVVSGYADILAIRHPKDGAAYVAAKNSYVPVINAGDGGHNHPTQTLTDLLTIYKEKGHFDNLCIGLCGDLKYGRTVHSLISAMTRYEGVSFVLISPKELALPDYIKDDILETKGIPCKEISSLEEAMPMLDVLYMTRIQRERFEDQAEYERLKDSYILDVPKLANAKADLCIMHPLPRVNEISVAVDDDPRACYFKQTRYGKFIRMALIIKLLYDHNDGKYVADESDVVRDLVCTNPRCITTTEQELRQGFRMRPDGVYRCIYCDSPGRKPAEA